jgi:CBS domain-containing protein
VVTAAHDISTQAAARLMSHHGISSLVLIDGDTVPIGIITDRDLRDKVAARGRSIAEPVSNIMSTSLIKAEASNYCFEALLTMLRHNIHHLLIVDQGRLRGIVTNHDLLVLQGTSPISVVREIEGQTDIDGLVQAAAKVAGIVGLLLKEGAHAGNITRIITEINDRLVRKVVEFALRQLRPRRCVVLALLRQRGAGAGFPDRPGQRPRVCRPGDPENRRARWFLFARFAKDGLDAPASRCARRTTWPTARAGTSRCRRGATCSPSGFRTPAPRRCCTRRSSSTSAAWPATSRSLTSCAPA